MQNLKELFDIQHWFIDYVKPGYQYYVYALTGKFKIIVSKLIDGDGKIDISVRWLTATNVDLAEIFSRFIIIDVDTAVGENGKIQVYSLRDAAVFAEALRLHLEQE
jgi:hypothetical protein